MIYTKIYGSRPFKGQLPYLHQEALYLTNKGLFVKYKHSKLSNQLNPSLQTQNR